MFFSDFESQNSKYFFNYSSNTTIFAGLATFEINCLFFIILIYRPFTFLHFFLKYPVSKKEKIPYYLLGLLLLCYYFRFFAFSGITIPYVGKH